MALGGDFVESFGFERAGGDGGGAGGLGEGDGRLGWCLSPTLVAFSGEGGAGHCCAPSIVYG